MDTRFPLPIIALAAAIACSLLFRSPARAQDTLASPTVIIAPEKGFLLFPCEGDSCQDGRHVVGKKGDALDYAGLREALVTLRKRYVKPRALTVMSGPEVSWQVVVQTIAHARRTADGKPLFPVIVLGFVPSGEGGAP